MKFNFTTPVSAFFIAITLFLTLTAQAQVATINTIAGNGIQSYGGDGLDAIYASLDLPLGVAVDDSGNVYIADEYNNRIRKVTESTGIITTIAGGGSSFGDGGPAKNSQVNTPTGIAVDDSANVYIVDDNRIRKITKTTGIINTIAGNGTWDYYGDGGPATDAELRALTVTLDDSGNVFIADFQNNRVREVNKKTGIIYTVAGTGYNAPHEGGYTGDGGQATDAELDYPSCVAIDDSGDIYISDDYNQVIRKVTARTGIINTIVGTGYGYGTSGSGGYTGDGGPATAAELSNPTFLVLDDSDNIYIADRWNERIRKVTAATGIITTFAGDSAGGYSGDGGPADSAELNEPGGMYFDVCGNLYLADWGNSRVRKITISGPSPTTTVLAPQTTICAGQSVSFRDSSNFNATNWSWSFFGGTPDTSISETPVVTYNSPGSYYITIYAWNICHTVFETLTDFVKVTPGPAIPIAPNPASVCPGASVVLTVPASGTGYIWSPASTLSSSTGDSVTATPPVTTTYTITGTDSMGCKASGTDVVSISTPPDKPTISQQGNVLTSSAKQGNQWVRNDTLLQGATNETYVVTITGWYQVITGNPANGCTATSDSAFYSPTGINQLTIESGQLTVYPNPTGGEINLTISSSVDEVKDWSLQVTDVLGRTLLTKSSLNYSNAIDLSNLSGGVYFICVINKAGRTVVSVVKQ